MAGLTRKDLDILKVYAEAGQRELYWNYLAHKQGNDGYPLLALGVVRNDNAPGATANAFAIRMAARAGVHLSEREWDGGGRELIKQDFARRFEQFEDDRPDLALNLPVKAVQDAHDEAFFSRGIPLNAWTPRELLENARNKAGEPAAERIWDVMLDNQGFGIARATLTTRDVALHADSREAAADYVRRMTAARVEASDAVPTTDPDVIRLAGTDYRRSADGHWRSDLSAYAVAKGLPAAIERDPARVAALEDTRALRLEQAALRTQFHPDDPNRHRPLARSPWLLAETLPDPQAPHMPTSHTHVCGRPDASDPLTGQPDLTPPATAPVATAVDPVDPRDPTHPRHGLWTSTEAAVHRLDASLGRTPDDASERMTASLYALAAGRGLRRVDHAVLSIPTPDKPAGHMVFAVQGSLDDPSQRLRTQMPTGEAITTPVEASLQRAHAAPAPVIAQVVEAPTQDVGEAAPQSPVLRRA